VKKCVFLMSAFLLVPAPVHAMHIMEGFLPAGWSLFWTLAALPFAWLGFRAVSGVFAEKPEYKMLLALCGAFIFVLSALKLPSVTGSSSHPTGIGLGAVLFGPAVMVVLSGIVLLFQAVLLAHGGITTLGANVFSMGVAGPLAAFGVYRLSVKAGLSRPVAVFTAAFTGSLATYIVTSLQLALAFPMETGGIAASFARFAGIFALTQAPLAVSEGIFTVIILNVLFNYNHDEIQILMRAGKGAA
jgi:cobalt/nickel transport system permease protein